MKKSVLRVAAVFMMIITVACLFYGCFKDKVPNEGIETVTDKDGVTYLAIVDDKDGHTLAGVTDDSGNLYAAEIDKSGKVLTDGNLYSVEYTGELPTNDTTAVSINESHNTGYNYADKDVVVKEEATATTMTTGDKSTTNNEADNGKSKDKNKDVKNGEDRPSTTDSQGSQRSEEDNKDVYLADKYKKLFESEKFYVEFSTDDESVPYPITAAVKNGNIYMKTQYEGMDCTMIYQKKKDSVYMVLNDYHVYCKMPSSMMDDLDLTDFVDKSEVRNIEVSDVELGERTCRSEAYTLKDGSISTYYFYNGELVRMDQISTSGETSIMDISKISSEVSDSLFELPKGYIPFNLSKFNFGDETTKGE